MSLTENGPFVENYIKKDINLIKEFYRSLGFYFVKIDVEIATLEKNKINIQYIIDKGKKAKITRIYFLGDKKIREKKLRDVCNSNHVDVDSNFNYGQMLDALMSELVEPKLIEPTFVTDYPKAISPLAKKHRNGNLNLVERFELFIGGAEFANAFTELNDPIDQRDRFELQARLAESGDDEAHPIDEKFLEAIECGMPPTAGVGIGVDRLVMLLTENITIKEVILFPSMRSEE